MFSYRNMTRFLLLSLSFRLTYCFHGAHLSVRNGFRIGKCPLRGADTPQSLPPFVQHRLSSIAISRYPHRSKFLTCLEGTPPSVYSAGDSNEDETNGRNRDGPIRRLRRSLSSLQLILLEVLRSLQRLLGLQTAQDSLMPGLRKKRLGRLMQVNKRQRLQLLGTFTACTLLLLNSASGKKVGKMPPPRELAYSELLTLLEKKPENLIGGVRVSPTRWDFTIALPMDHPAKGRPLTTLPVALASKQQQGRDSSSVPTPPLITTTTHSVAQGTIKQKGGGSRAAKVMASLKERVPKHLRERRTFSAVFSQKKKKRQSLQEPVSLPLFKAVRFYSRPVSCEPYAMDLLRKQGILFGARSISKTVGLLRVFFPVLYFGLIWTGYQRMMGKGSSGKAGSRLAPSALPTGAGFSQVAGVGAAKQEVSEIVQMLRDPTPFIAAGARLPSGVLLVGPPGTGKTLLARAVAAEAGVPFFYCSGSDFIEMFVGRGAARVRTLFKTAKKASPCILFVDELDAIGKMRNTNSFSIRDNSEAEQTLNQLLAAMDGVDTSNDGVVVLAATNRFSLLDEALTRPGRFDRIVKVPLPDEQGRREILAVHCRSINLGRSEDEVRAVIEYVATLTPGSSGAELAALVNEATIRAVRRSRSAGMPGSSSSASFGAPQVLARDFTDAINTSNEARGKAPGGAVGQILKDAITGMGNK